MDFIKHKPDKCKTSLRLENQPVNGAIGLCLMGVTKSNGRENKSCPGASDRKDRSPIVRVRTYR